MEGVGTLEGADLRRGADTPFPTMTRTWVSKLSNKTQISFFSRNESQQDYRNK